MYCVGCVGNAHQYCFSVVVYPVTANEVARGAAIGMPREPDMHVTSGPQPQVLYRRRSIGSVVEHGKLVLFSLLQDWNVCSDCVFDLLWKGVG